MRGRTASEALDKRARQVAPGGVHSNVRLDGPHTFFARGKGAWLWDVDGNDYVDYLLGQGPAVLIFDEIITGFRLAPGGAAHRFGVTPDLATYGKAIGGSWPVGALAGRRELMEPFGTGKVNHSGTFNANVMAMAAVVASLKLLAERPPYQEIERVGTALMEGLRTVSRERGWPLRLQGVPMAFHAGFGDEDEEVFDYRSLQRLDTNRYRKLAGFLVEEGVWVAPRGIWYVSAAHNDREVEVTLERAGTALARL